MEGQALATSLLALAPVLIEFAAIVLLYSGGAAPPGAHAPCRTGALLAVAMLELVRWGLSAYLGGFQSYERIYGSTVAFLPIFLLWIYLCWVSVLLGASLASSIAAVSWLPAGGDALAGRL